MPMLYFFLGAVAGGIPLIVKQSGAKRLSWRSCLYLILGLLVVSLFAFIPSGSFQSEMNAGPASFLLLAAAGVISAAALVLPGISISYLLLLMGIYDEMMRAVSEFYLPFLLPLAAGLVLGILLITKGLEYAMTRHPHPTYFIILGFILGSIGELFPGIPSGGELVLCILTLAAGFFAVLLLSRTELKSTAASA
jgi:putative membrane protein